MHLVVVSYEFTFSPFSGNGILARSLVKSLLNLGHGDSPIEITVFCCRPHRSARSTSPDQPLEPPEIPGTSKLNVYSIELDEEQRWKCLDIDSAWREFVADRLQVVFPELFMPSIASSSFDAALVIDWTGAHAWKSIQSKIKEIKYANQASPTTPKMQIPIIYFNFRVYSLGAKDNRDFYDEMEHRALEQAHTIVALSEMDRKALQKLLVDVPEGGTSAKAIEVVVPPLRGDIEALATVIKSTTAIHPDLPQELKAAVLANIESNHRIFVTCIARLGREKQVARFVQLIASTPELWKNTSFIPLLAGAVSDPEYAATVTTALQQECPSAIILDRFLSATELAAVLQHTCLNVHPCAYDAYGMTIIEAAAFGVPSIVSRNVGALATLGYDEGAFVVDMDEDEEVVDAEFISTLRESLGNSAFLQNRGAICRSKALAWNESAYGAAIRSYVRSAVEFHDS